MHYANEIISSFLSCRLKATKALDGIVGSKTDFEKVEIRLREQAKVMFIQNSSAIFNKHDVIQASTSHNEKFKSPVIVINPEYRVSDYKLSFDAIEFKSSKLSKLCAMPIMISHLEKVSQNEKIILTAMTLLMNEALSCETTHALILHGKALKILRLSINSFKKKAQQILHGLQAMRINIQKPIPIKSDSCKVCEFAESCIEEISQKDDLSLLGSISLKEVARLNKKGILTITQLSYNFRPNRFRRLRKKGRPFSYELKALSVRDKKVWLIA